MRQITRLSICFLFFILTAVTQAQENSRKLSPYTKVFLSSIRQTEESSVQKRALYKRAAVRQVGNRNYLSAFIYLTENAGTETLVQQGVEISTRAGDLITAQIPVDVIESVAALPEVKYVQMGTPVQKRMDKARAASGVDKVQAGTPPLAAPYFGKDIVIGIIDNGFEYGHPNFYSTDHSALRIKKVWDQNAFEGNIPSKFSYGAEYTQQESILAAIYDAAASHGTHVAGIATGADRSAANNYYGVAGESEIVLVAQAGSSTNVADGIKYIFDYADSVGKPCVINLSLGSYIGPHDGTSAFDVLTDQLQGKGRLLVGSAGNEAGKKIHISKTFNATDSIFKTFLKFKDNVGCDIWGEAGKDFKIQLCIYDTLTLDTFYISPEYSTTDVNSETRLNLTAPTGKVIRGSFYISTGNDPQNNKPNAFFYSALTAMPEKYCLGLSVKATDGRINAWTDESLCSFTNRSHAAWSDGDDLYTIGEIGGTGKQIITVGAYVSNTTYTNLNNENQATSETLNTLASFSSTGPTIDGRMKPEITAPGSIIASSVSSYDTANPTERVKSTEINGKTYYYGMMQGTSMAAPYVTGVLATWLQANPTLTPDEIKAILQKTAINDSFTGNLLPNGNSSWGYGKIDAYAGIVEAIKQSTAINETPVSSQSVLMYISRDNQQLINFLFTQEDSNVQINVFNVNGQKLLSKQVGEISGRQEETIDLGGMPKGLYLIKISGNKLNQVFKASTK